MNFSLESPSPHKLENLQFEKICSLGINVKPKFWFLKRLVLIALNAPFQYSDSNNDVAFANTKYRASLSLSNGYRIHSIFSDSNIAIT